VFGLERFHQIWRNAQAMLGQRQFLNETFLLPTGQLSADSNPGVTTQVSQFGMGQPQWDLVPRPTAMAEAIHKQSQQSGDALFGFAEMPDR